MIAADLSRLPLGLAVVLAAGLLMGLGVGPVLRRLPEPPQDPSSDLVQDVVVGGADPDSLERDRMPLGSDGGPNLAEAKLPYRELARPRFVLVCVLSTVTATAVVVLTVPVPLWPPWLVLGTLGVLLACIDGATTWLPWRLTWPGWLAMLIAAGASLALGAGWMDVLRLVGSGLIAWLWYLLIYLLTRRQLGLGDVWLAPLVGAPAGMISFGTLYLALLLGALVGGLHGLLLMLRRRRGGFPYAPSIVAGGFLAAIAHQLLS